MLDPSTWRTIHWPAEQSPMVVVVVDTEAEFDWARQRPRRAMGVTSVKSQVKVQRIFERYQVRPTYVLDYPVSSTPESYEIIREFISRAHAKSARTCSPGTIRPFLNRRQTRTPIPVICRPSWSARNLCGSAELSKRMSEYGHAFTRRAAMGSVARRRRSSPSSATRSI